MDRADAAPLPVRSVLALASMLTVAPLLAWVHELGSFSVWLLACTLPALAAVTAVSVWWWRTGRFPATVTDIRAGVIGGVLGTLGYDLVRVPVVLAGRQVLAPIDSYGVLALSAPASSALTGFAGWGYHFLNGVFFAVAFALVCSRRPAWWAVAFALALESGAVFSNFADFYGLNGEYGLIAIAYLAHVPYGLALAWMTGRPGMRLEPWRRSLTAPVAATLAAVLVILVLWLRPFSAASSSDITLRQARFHPTWARVAEGECVRVANSDGIAADLDGTVIAPSSSARFCPGGAGVHRVKVSGKAHSGGFVIVDPAG